MAVVVHKEDEMRFNPDYLRDIPEYRRIPLGFSENIGIDHIVEAVIKRFFSVDLVKPVCLVTEDRDNHPGITDFTRN